MASSAYEGAGVKDQGEALSGVVRHLAPTLALPRHAEVLTRFGHYASVLKISDDIAVAITTDGVGSKTLIASALDRYDTIGFDCVAMNANDVLCVGARPIAMVDYLAVNTLDSRRADEILRGLGAAAKEAGIAIPGGELAQLPEIVGPGDEAAFDLAGACLGLVHPDKVILGDRVEAGDVLIGLRSSGVHSNGLTLACRVLLGDGRYRLSDEIPSFGRSLGDELLEPTEIYVRAATALWDAGVDTRGMVHVTGDGLANLCRLESEVGYEVDALPDPPAIFALIQEAGELDDGEMFRVFNMGIGFVVVVPEAEQGEALQILASTGYAAQRIGRATTGPRTVRIASRRLVGALIGGESRFEREQAP